MLRFTIHSATGVAKLLYFHRFLTLCSSNCATTRQETHANNGVAVAFLESRSLHKDDLNHSLAEGGASEVSRGPQALCVLGSRVRHSNPINILALDALPRL